MRRDTELSVVATSLARVLAVDPADAEVAIINIALDIAMFNSYSFLRDMNITQKQEASKLKYEFYKACGNLPFYECNETDLGYFSLAFLSRMSADDFDVDGYINTWNDFTAYYYSNQAHVEMSLREQIKLHVDFDELPKRVHCRFADKPKGGYLLLRTNTDRTEGLHPQIFTLFGIRHYRKGHIKVIPLSEHDKYKHLFETLDVSAFKVIIP